MPLTKSENNSTKKAPAKKIPIHQPIRFAISEKQNNTLSNSPIINLLFYLIAHSTHSTIAVVRTRQIYTSAREHNFSQVVLCPIFFQVQASKREEQCGVISLELEFKKVSSTVSERGLGTFMASHLYMRRAMGDKTAAG